MSVRLHFYVKPLDQNKADKNLEAFRKEHGDKVTGVNDIFSLGMLNADYEIVVDENHILYSLTKEKFLSALVLGTYVTEQKTVLEGAESIAVHHPVLGIQAFVSLTASGTIFVTYSTVEGLKDKKNVILAVGPNASYTSYDLANELNNKDKYDRIMLGTEMNLCHVPNTIEHYQVPEKYIWGFRPKNNKS